MDEITARIVSHAAHAQLERRFTDHAERRALNMKIHGFAQRMITVLRHALAFCPQRIIGLYRSITGNKLHRLAGLQHRLQTIKDDQKAEDRFRLSYWRENRGKNDLIG